MAIISFIEAIFFPIPPDVVLIPLVLIHPESGIYYALLAAVTSVIGGAVGYGIGLKGGKPLIKRLKLETRLSRVEQLIERYDIWATAIAGFTPIPFKVFAIAAGVFTLNLTRFLLVAFISRAARFVLISGLLMLYGEKVSDFIKHNFEWLTVGLTIGVFVLIGIHRWIVVQRAHSTKG